MADSTAFSVSPEGLAHLMTEEGLSKTLYDDGGKGRGHCTIGHGHLVHYGVCDGNQPSEKEFLNGITEEKSASILTADLAWAEKAVNELVTASLTQNQADALVSFVFNVGADAFKKSTLLSVINENKLDQVPAEFRKWVKTDGNRSQILVNRREREIVLFQKNEEK